MLFSVLCFIFLCLHFYVYIFFSWHALSEKLIYCLGKFTVCVPALMSLLSNACPQVSDESDSLKERSSSKL